MAKVEKNNKAANNSETPARLKRWPFFPFNGFRSTFNDPSFIPARRNFLGELLVFWLGRRGLWKAFRAVRFRAAGPLPASPDRLTEPLIFYANHNTFWDGYLAHVLFRQVYGLEGYLMMDLQQMRRFKFFSWAGVFSVDRANGRQAMRSLDYIAGELQGGPGRALWIFPQGEISPQERRPLGFQSGLARLIRRVGPCYVYPVAVRYEFFTQSQPEFLISVGEARHFTGQEKPDHRALAAELEQTLQTELDRLKADVNSLNLADFITIIRGKSSQ